MDAAAPARSWADTWRSAWPKLDADAIAALYADGHSYRALAFGKPTTAPPDLTENFAVESNVECWFGEPVVDDDRAAVEWWGTWIEGGKRVSLAGTTLLRFGADGMVVNHRDYWNEVEGRVVPYGGW